MHAFEALIFDFGNVLIDLDIPKWESNMTSLIDSRFLVEDLRPVLTQHFHKMERGELTIDEFYQGIEKYTKSEVTRDDVQIQWNSIFIGIKPNVFDLLLALREKYKVYLLSNTNVLHMDWVYMYLENQYQITDWDNRFFDRTLYSHELGLRKPDLNIYLKVIELLDITPAKTLFFDDLVDNIVLAKQVGIHGYVKPPLREIKSIVDQLGLL